MAKKAKKHIKTEVKRSPTKRQLSKWQRQKRMQRIIIIVGVIFIALVVGYIGYGYYGEQVKPLHEPVLRINDTVYDLDYYVKMLELYSRGVDAEQIGSVADEIVNAIVTGDLIRRVSADLGFGVSADEVNEGLKSMGLPDDKVYRDVVTSRLLAARLLQNYFDPKVPTECEQVQVQAMFLESEEMAEKIIDMLEAGDDFVDLAKEYSLEATTKSKGGDLGWLPKDFAYVFLGDLGESSLKDIPFELEAGELSKPTYDGLVTKGLGYWLVQVTEEDKEKGKHAWGILLGSRKVAEEIRARIEAGEDFSALAREYSQHLQTQEQGGDLGWTQEWRIDSRVALGIAMPLEPGAVSQPTVDDTVLTKGGYWVVKAVDRDDSRVLDEEARSEVKLRLSDDLINEQSKKDSIDVYLTEEQKARAMELVLKER